jgi:hypothetical protein
MNTVTTLAVADLTSGSHALYTIIVGVLVLAALAGGGARAVVCFFGGRIGHAVAWALVGTIVATIIGGGYGIHLAMKKTTDKTGWTCSNSQYCE